MTAAERQRRRRERIRQGRMLLTVEVDHIRVAEALKAQGLLGEYDEDDPGAIGDAVEQVLERLSRRWASC